MAEALLPPEACETDEIIEPLSQQTISIGPSWKVGVVETAVIKPQVPEEVEEIPPWPRQAGSRIIKERPVIGPEALIGHGPAVHRQLGFMECQCYFPDHGRDKVTAHRRNSRF